MANEFKKPVIIHCVGAFQEIIKIKKDLNITVPAIIHGFSKNETVAKDLVKNGFYISFGKYLFENPLLKNVFHKIPNDSFFLETDSSHQKIEAIYNLAAAYKNISIDDVKKNIENNFKKVFKISL